jgi:hypothetical protein
MLSLASGFNKKEYTSLPNSIIKYMELRNNLVCRSNAKIKAILLLRGRKKKKKIKKIIKVFKKNQ